MIMDSDSQNIAVVSYITPAGWIVALIVRLVCNVQTPFAIFHLRQGLGLNIILITLWIIFKIVEIWVIEQIAYILVVISALYGIVSALKGQQKYQIPFGKLFDSCFTFIK